MTIQLPYQQRVQQLDPESILSISHLRTNHEIIQRLEQDITSSEHHHRHPYEGLVLRRISCTQTVCAALWKVLRQRDVAYTTNRDDTTSSSSSSSSKPSWKRIELRNLLPGGGGSGNNDDGTATGVDDITNMIMTFMMFTTSIEEFQLVMNSMTIVPSNIFYAISMGCLQKYSILTCLRITTTITMEGMKQLMIGLVGRQRRRRRQSGSISEDDDEVETTETTEIETSCCCSLKVLDLSWSSFEEDGNHNHTTTATTTNDNNNNNINNENTATVPPPPPPLDPLQEDALVGGVMESNGSGDDDDEGSNDESNVHDNNIDEENIAPTTTPPSSAPTTTSSSINPIITELAKGLRTNSSLQILRLVGCRINDESIYELITSLQYHPTLECLDLNGNKGGYWTSHAIADLLSTVVVEGGGDSGSGSERVMDPFDRQSISSSLQQQQQQQSRRSSNGSTNSCRSKLKSLDLSFQNSNSTNNRQQQLHRRLDIPYLASALRTNTTLQILDLSNDDIDDSDIESLCHILFNNDSDTDTGCSLQELLLARNKITDHGICILSQYLSPQRRRRRRSSSSSSSCLKRLSLWGNPFDVIGAKALATSLITNVDIEEIDIYRTFPESEQIMYYTNLNRAGRKLLLIDENEHEVRNEKDENDNEDDQQQHHDHHPSTMSVPLALWPLVLDRINRIPFSNGCTTSSWDLVYYMVRWGPALLHSR